MTWHNLGETGEFSAQFLTALGTIFSSFCWMQLARLNATHNMVDKRVMTIMQPGRFFHFDCCHKKYNHRINKSDGPTNAKHADGPAGLPFIFCKGKF